jgi:hypothetical protein
MDDDTRLALAIFAGHAVSLFAFDLWLITTGRPSISSAIRQTPIVRRWVANLASHATDTIEGDLYSAIGRLIAVAVAANRRRPVWVIRRGPQAP